MSAQPTSLQLNSSLDTALLSRSAGVSHGVVSHAAASHPAGHTALTTQHSGHSRQSAITGHAIAGHSAALRPGQSFQDRLNSLMKTHTDPQAEKVKAAQEGAAGLVSNALILPMLKQVRRSVWHKDGPFSGGLGEKTFGPEFDTQIADRLAHSPRMPVTAALAKRLLARQNATTATTTLKGSGVNVNG
jgi:hypothetical protein